MDFLPFMGTPYKDFFGDVDVIMRVKLVLCLLLSAFIIYREYVIPIIKFKKMPDALWNAKVDWSEEYETVYEEYVDPKEIIFYQTSEIEDGKLIQKYYVKFSIARNWLFEDEYIEELNRVHDAKIIETIKECLQNGYDESP